MVFKTLKNDDHGDNDNDVYFLVYLTAETNIVISRYRNQPASRAFLLLQGGEIETLRKSCHFFEAAAVQISGLATLVLCRQTGFYSARIIFCR